MVDTLDIVSRSVLQCILEYGVYKPLLASGAMNCGVEIRPRGRRVGALAALPPVQCLHAEEPEEEGRQHLAGCQGRSSGEERSHA